MAAGAGIAAAAIAQAIKVCVAPEEFAKILNRVGARLVVVATGGVFKRNYQYITSYKGLAFYTKCAVTLSLPASVELIEARAIWIPGLG